MQINNKNHLTGCLDCFSSIENEIYSNYYNQGIHIVAAAGNAGSSDKSYPASYPSVISVASVGSNNQRSSFSQYNNQVEISAPGGSIYSTYKTGYAYLSGTSMATPHVAGVIALLRMLHPQCDVNAIRRVIAYTAKDLQTKNCDWQTGHGLIQAKTAYDRLALGNCGYLTGYPSNEGCYNVAALPTKKPVKPKSQKKKEKRLKKKEKKQKKKEKKRKKEEKKLKKQQKKLKKKEKKLKKKQKKISSMPSSAPSRMPSGVPSDQPTQYPTISFNSTLFQSFSH